MAEKGMLILYATAFMLAGLVLVQADCTLEKLEPCDSESPKDVVKMARFNGTCENETMLTPVFVIGETYKIQIDFRPDMDAENAKMELKVKFGPFLIPQKVGNPDACTDKGLTCPLRADTNYTFTDIFPVSPVAPVYRPVKVALLWSLLNEKPSFEGKDNSNDNGADDNKVIYCVKIPVTIKPAPKTTTTTTTTTTKPPPLFAREEPDFRVVH